MKRHSDERTDGQTDKICHQHAASGRYETNLDTTQHSQIPTHTHAAAMKFDTMRVRHLECKRRGGGWWCWGRRTQDTGQTKEISI